MALPGLACVCTVPMPMHWCVVDIACCRQFCRCVPCANMSIERNVDGVLKHAYKIINICVMLNVDLFTINVVHRMRFLYKTLPRRTEKKHTKCGKILEWKIPKANNMHLWCMCVNVRVFDGIWCVDKLRSSQHAAGCYNVITVQNWQTFVIAPFSSSNKQRPATSVPINTHNTFAL